MFLKNNILYAIFEGEKRKVIKIWTLKLNLKQAKLIIDPRIDETKCYQSKRLILDG